MKKTLFIIFFSIIFYHTAFSIGTDQSIIEKAVTTNQENNFNLIIYTKKPAVFINAYNWTIDPDGNSVIFQNQPITDWLIIPNFIKKKDPNLTYIEIPYTVKIKNPVQAEYLAKLIISEADDKNTNINITMGLGIPIYVYFKDKIKMNNSDIMIKQVRYDHKKSLLEVIVENNSNVHIRPDINFTIEKSKTNLGTENLTSGWPILPTSTRKFSKKIDLKPGKYQLIFTSTWGKLYNLSFSKKEVKTLIL